MLGKCIKNEFVNRFGQVAALSIGILVFSGVICGLNALGRAIDNDYFRTFVLIMDGLFGIAMMIVVFALIFMPCTDFTQRFFKDQGYLTHTLPVKTSTIIVARMICDIVMVTLLALLYPLCICIAMRDFEFFSSFITWLENMFQMAGSSVERSLLVLDAILLVIGMWLGVLFSLWSINLAYSFGHSFSKGKRLMSVIGYIALAIIYCVLVVVVGEILSSPGVSNALNKMVDSADTMAGTWRIIWFAIDIVELLGVAALAVSTSWICKHKLNLE